MLRMESEFAVHALEMFFNGAFSDTENRGDLPWGFTMPNPFQDLGLTRCQMRWQITVPRDADCGLPYL